MNAHDKPSNRTLAGVATALGVAIGVAPGALLAQATTQVPAVQTPAAQASGMAGQQQPSTQPATNGTPNAAARYWKVKVSDGAAPATGTAQIQAQPQGVANVPAVQSKGVPTTAAYQSKGVPVPSAYQSKGLPTQQVKWSATAPDTGKVKSGSKLSTQNPN